MDEVIDVISDFHNMIIKTDKEFIDTLIELPKESLVEFIKAMNEKHVFDEYL